jgi:hypothetical protein
MSPAATLGLTSCSVSENVCDEFWLLLQSKLGDAAEGRRSLKDIFLRNLIESFRISNHFLEGAIGESIGHNHNLCPSFRMLCQN